MFEELLVNALIHRDYLIEAPIRLFVFSDRIEIVSPGHLPNNLTVEKIRSGIHEVMGGGTVLEAIIARRFWNYFHSLQTSARPKETPWGLSPVELDVLKYVTKGLSNAEVGTVMSLERRSVRTHRTHIYRKMCGNSHV